jgi:hypothetical protein
VSIENEKRPPGASRFEAGNRRRAATVALMASRASAAASTAKAAADLQISASGAFQLSAAFPDPITTRASRVRRYAISA